MSIIETRGDLGSSAKKLTVMLVMGVDRVVNNGHEHVECQN